MIKLNLETKNEAENRIKEYLENNVSEILAEKINNGVQITKNEKTLINKKDLFGFMKYANDEARKLAETGANYACIEDKVVYGWAIHYFEEDSIEGKLYNEDGSEYKIEIKQQIKSTPLKEQPKKKENTQASLFELMNSSTTTQENKIEKKDTRFKLTEEEKRILRDVFDEEVEDEEDIDEEPIEYDVVDDEDNNIEDFTESEIENELDIIAEEIKLELSNKTSSIQTKTTSFDKEITKKLYALFEGNLEVK